MSLNFNSGTDSAYYAKNTTDLGSSISSWTLIFHAKATTGKTTKQGVLGGIQTAGVPTTHYFFYSGTEIRYGVNAGYTGVFGSVTPSDSTWYTYVLRQDGTDAVEAGAVYADIYNGTGWETRVVSSTFHENITPSKVFLGNDGLASLARAYAVDGMVASGLRYWGGTHLSDAEVLAERTAALAVITTNCKGDWSLNDTLSDAQGGDALSVSATYPTLDAIIPPFIVSASGPVIRRTTVKLGAGL